MCRLFDTPSDSRAFQCCYLATMMDSAPWRRPKAVRSASRNITSDCDGPADKSRYEYEYCTKRFSSPHAFHLGRLGRGM